MHWIDLLLKKGEEISFTMIYSHKIMMKLVSSTSNILSRIYAINTTLKFLVSTLRDMNNFHNTNAKTATLFTIMLLIFAVI